MGKKKLTISAPTVEEAIASGLEEIGLPQESTYIEVLQESSSGFFKKTEAIVSIIFDEDEAFNAKQRLIEKDYGNSLEILLEDGKALAKIPEALISSSEHTFEQKHHLLRELLEQKRIHAPSPELISKLLNTQNASQYFLPVKEYSPKPLGNTKVSLDLEVAQDKMSCLATLFFPKDSSEEISFDLIVEALKDAHVIKGVFKNRIEKALNEQKNCSFIIAEGKPTPSSSKDKLDLFFQESEKKVFKEMMEAIRIDTRDIKDLNVCERNQLLARIQKGDTSAIGYQVDGKAPSSSSSIGDKSIHSGENTYWSEDKTEIYSKLAGHIKWNNSTRTVSVEPVYVVDGNVDFSEGNLEGFVGKVIIKGDVMPKFKVSVDGDIEIHGTVEDAIVESHKGSVVILGSVVHHNEGYIKAKESIEVGIAQNATLQAKNVHISKEAMNCTIKATEGVYIEGSPGVLVGGEIYADKKIRAKTVGSASWVKTSLHAGDIREDLKKSKRYKSEIRTLKEQLEDHKQALELLQSLSNLSEAQQEKRSFLEDEIEGIKSQIEAFEKELSAIDLRTETSKEARIEIIDRIYPQVDLYIYDSHLLPNEEQIHSLFTCRKKRIETRPL